MAATLFVVAQGESRSESDKASQPVVGPGPKGKVVPSHPRLNGCAQAGQDVFRFEAFGNEGLGTEAMRMPKGIVEAKVTPIDALKLGLMMDINAVPADLSGPLATEFKSDLSPRNAPLLNDPTTTMKPIAANAGIVPKGDMIGVSCALCHTVTR